MRIVAFLLLSVVPLVVTGQTDVNARIGYLSFGGGLCIPVTSIFKDSGPEQVTNLGPNGVSSGNTASGYALPGITFRIDASIPIRYSHFGFVSSLEYDRNKFNLNKYSNYLNSGSTAYTVSSNNPYFTEYTLLTGMYYTIYTDRFSVNFNLMIGASKCQSPELLYTYFSTVQNSVISQENTSTSAYALAESFGIAFRYSVTKKICALANVEYMHTFPTFNVRVNSYYSSSYPTYCPIALLNSAIGIGYIFER